MFQNLYPDEDVDSAYQIDYQKYYDQGYRGILFDVDNTLVEHNQPVTLVAIELFQTLNEMGFKTCIISNNRDERVKPLAEALESDYVYKAGKPSARHEEIQISLKRLLEKIVLIGYRKQRAKKRQCV